MLVYPKPSLPKNIFDPGGALVGAVEGPKVEKWGLFKPTWDITTSRAMVRIVCLLLRLHVK